MRPHFTPAPPATLFSGLPIDRFFEAIPPEDCPRNVATTVRSCLDSGRIDRILAARGRRNPCYFVEVALSGNHDRKLHISEDGTLLTRVDALRESELPSTVKSAVTGFLEAGARFDTADRVFTPESAEFHVELDLGDGLDLHLFLDDRGEVLRRHEVGDF